jgi:hypothetical protein
MLKRKISKIYRSLTSSDWWLDTAASFLRFLIKRNPIGLLKKDFNRKHPYWAASTSLAIVILIFSGSIWLAFSHSPKTQAAWWNDSWMYRKAVAINNSASLVNNQYVKITLDTNSLVASGKMQNDCDDIRIVNSSGNLLTHFIDGNSSYACNTANTSVYVRMDSIPASGTTVYMYYGNSSASNNEPVLGSQQYPGVSCKNILQHRSDSRGTGQYHITPTGNSADVIQVTCEMTYSSGGWIDVWHGLPSEAFVDNSEHETVNLSNNIVFNEMRVEATNLSYNVTDTVAQTAKLGSTIRAYFYQVNLADDATSPKVAFHNLGGTQNVSLTNNRFMYGYGNSWRFFYQCVDVDSLNYIYLGACAPGSVPRNGFNSASVGCTSGSYNDYCNNARNTTPKDSGMNLSLYEYQESSVYVRENEIVLNMGQSMGTVASEEKAPSPVAYWKFDEGSGIAANDSTWKKIGSVTNLITNPSFENNTTGWSASGATVAATAETRAVVGTKYAKVVGSGSGTYPRTTYTFNSLPVGNYALQFRYKADSATAANGFWYAWAFQPSATSLTTGTFSNTGISDTDGWVTVRSTFSVASGQSDIQLWFYLNGNASATSTLLLDGIQVESGSVINKYCDGSLIGNGSHVWNETAHVSTSTCDLGADGQIDGAFWKNESECISGKCLSFDGTNDYVSMGDVLDMGTGNFTVSAWVKSTSTATGNNNGIVYKRGTAYGYSPGFRLNMPNGQFNFHIADGTNYQTVTVGSAGQYNDGKWHFVSATATRGSEMRIYVDGESKGFVTENNVGNIDTSAPLGIGAYIGSYHFFSGSIDEVRIHPFARSAEQIKMDYNSGLAGSGAAEGSAQSFGGKSDKWVSDGLVGYWKMDEASWNGTTGEVKDASGNNNNGTSAGGATTASAKYGNGGSFDGSSDYVVADSLLTNIASKNVTLAGWMKSSSTTKQECIASFNLAGGGNKFILGHISGVSTLQFYNGSAWIDTSVVVFDGNWHYVSFVFDDLANSIDFFVDGKKVYTTTLAASFLATDLFSFGQEWDSAAASDFFTGSMDEFRVYNRALSPEEIRKLYEWAPGPIAYWRLDENSGNSFADASGNSLNGSLGIDSAVPGWKQGKYGAGLDFGNGDYARVALGSSSSIFSTNTTGRSFSYALWFKSSNVSATQSLLANNEACNNRGNFSIRLEGGNIRFGYYGSPGGGADHYFTPSTALQNNQWYHLEWTKTFGQTGAKAYLNGITQTVIDDSANLGSGSLPNVVLGAYNGDGVTCTTGVDNTPPVVSSSLNGSLDDVKIYNYVRNSDQVIEDMNGAGNDADSGGGTVEPLAYWKMEEGSGTTVKNSGSGGITIDATLTGTASPTWSNNGKFGKALSFTNGYAQTSNQTINSSFTYSAWFKPTSAFVNWAAVITNLYHAAPASGINIVPMNGSIRICYGDGVNSYSNYTITVPEIVLNQWNNAAVSYDGTNIKLFVNGVLKDSRAATVVQTSQNIRMGIWASSYADYLFNGLIDEVKIYNAALSEDEIEADFNQGKSAVMSFAGMNIGGSPDASAIAEYCVPGDASSCSAPIGEWKFDEKQATTVNNSSGSGNNATLTNGPTWTTGKFGSAAQFDGSDDLALLTSTINLAGNANWTASTWVKTGSASTNSVLSNNNGGPASNDMRVDASKISYSHYSGSWLYEYGTSNIADNKWHYLTWVNHSNQTIDLYVDGKAENMGANSAQSNGPINSIGRNWNSSFNGAIDNVRIYNYVRTPAQIAYEYNRGAPIGWWKFDECQGGIANDSSGNGNNGTMNIGATGTQTSAGSCSTALTAWGNGANGKFNSSLNFDGTDDRMQTNDLYENDNMTWSAWIKTSGNGAIAGTNYGSASLFWHGGMVVNSGLARMEIGYIDSTYRYQAGTKTVNDNIWHHIAMTSDSSGSKLYIDGELDASSSYYVGQVAGSYEQATCIGFKCRPTTTDIEFFPGQIDDVRMYNYALTNEQIKNVMNEGSALRFGQ